MKHNLKKVGIFDQKIIEAAIVFSKAMRDLDFSQLDSVIDSIFKIYSDYIIWRIDKIQWFFRREDVLWEEAIWSPPVMQR